jgi:hypothetical protein
MSQSKDQALRDTLNRVFVALGPSIQKTIMWHMNNRGVFSDPKRVDFEAVYRNLEELLGPLSDEIVDMTWERLIKDHGARGDSRSKKSIEMIKDWMEMEAN